ncbi:MAG TPA: chitin binding peritrophin-A domain-containing protein [Pseudonocardiaceae bacterium]|jgi:hypothetical protein
MTFDVNDRSTWAWNQISPTFIEGDGYTVDPTSAQHFYQATDGGPVRHLCPESTMYNPSVTPGPNYPNTADEDKSSHRHPVSSGAALAK